MLAIMGLCMSHNQGLQSMAHAHLLFRADMQSYKFNAGWKAIFVTFREPNSLPKVLDHSSHPFSRKDITLGPEKTPYAASRMDANRLAQYQPPCKFHEIGTFAAASHVDPTRQVSRPSSPMMSASSPSSTVISTLTASGAVIPDPSESGQTLRPHKPVPTAPQAMVRRSSYLSPLPSAPHPSPASSIRPSPNVSDHKLPPRPLATNLPRTEDSNLERLRQKILSTQYDISDAETRLQKYSEKHSALAPARPSVSDDNLIRSLESRVADERSHRKSLERERARLLRDLDEVDVASERELERKGVAEAELRRVSRQARWRRTALMSGSAGDSMDTDHVGSITGTAELDKLQKESEKLRQDLAAIDHELSMDDQVCARLVRERDVLQQESQLVGQSTSNNNDAVNVDTEGPQPLTPFTPAMLNALLTLDAISLSILQKIEPVGPKTIQSVNDANVQQPPVPSSIGIKRRRSVSMD